MEREGSGRCAAQGSADNSRVGYIKAEHRGAHLTAATRPMCVWRVKGSGRASRERDTGRENEEV